MKSRIAYLALCLALAGCGNGSQIPQASNEYAVRDVTTSVCNLSTSYPATIKGIQDIEIRPKVGGFITKVHVDEGDFVHKGQVLFSIDRVQYEAAVKSAEAAVRVAKTTVSTQELTVKNKKMLHSQGIISDYDMEMAENELASAQAQLASANAQLVDAKNNLSFCSVTSPSDGVVGTIPYRVGSLVSSTTAEPLTTVSNISQMYVYFSMTEKQLLEYTKGTDGVQGALAAIPPVNLRLVDGSLYDQTGKVTNVSGDVDAAPADNSRSQEMFFYPADMTRSFLVENFTGQECSNCPGGHADMEEAIERSGMDVVSVSYHSGYNPDAFTMLEDYYYQTFYGVKGAPSFMVNRFANPSIDPSSPVFQWGSLTVAMITDCLEKQAAEQPYVGVNINTNYDEATRRLTGKVDVVAYRKPQMANPSLQLLLVQDSIVGNQTNGGSNYVHRHVNRGSLNGYFGEKLGEMADGATVTREIDYTLPESIMSTYDGNMSKSEDIPTDPKHMYLVAIVGNYNADDPADCLVLNCAAVKFGASTASGIAELPAAQAGASARLEGSAGSLRAEGNFDALYIYNVGGKLAARCTAPGQTLGLEPGVYVTRAVKGGAVSTAKCVVAR